MALRSILVSLSFWAMWSVCLPASGEPTAEEVRAASAAGAYATATAYLYALNTSECSYTVRLKAPDLGGFLIKEILPSFSRSSGNELSGAALKMWPEWTAEGRSFINSVVQDGRKDKNSACGYAAGVIVERYQRAKYGWIAAKRDLK